MWRGLTADRRAWLRAGGSRLVDRQRGTAWGLDVAGGWTHDYALWGLHGRDVSLTGGSISQLQPGTPVLAATDGVVAGVGWDPDGYGHYIVLDHGGGWQTVYAHLQPAATERLQESSLGMTVSAHG